MAKSFIGSERADPDGVLELVKHHGGDPTDAVETVKWINTYAGALTLNARLLVAVMMHEAASLDSGRYRVWRNPGGIAISSDHSTEVWRPNVPNPQEVAGMLVAAFAQKILRRSVKAEIPVAYAVKGMEAWLDRSLSFTEGPDYPAHIELTSDMTKPFEDERGELQYVWAEDQHWDEGVDAWYEIVPRGKDSPVPTGEITFGNVPHPHFRDRPIHKAEGEGQNDLGQRTVKGVSWHRVLGRLESNYEYFHTPSVHSLTDYIVGTLDVDGSAGDGVIDRYNDPLGRQSGWASGTYSSAAYGDGLAFVQKYGVDAINRDRASIEISGFQTTPLSAKAREAICGLTAYWADQYQIPWDKFPISPKDGFSFVCWHEEFGPDHGQKKCPFEAVKALTPAMIEQTAQIMKHYQVGSQIVPVKTYANPVLPDWWAESLKQVHPGDDKFGGHDYRVCRRNCVVKVKTTPVNEPKTGAKPVGPVLDVGHKLYIERIVDGKFFLTTEGHYVYVSKVSPSVVMKFT